MKTLHTLLVLVAILFPVLATAEETTHDTLVIVIDGSGSMKEPIESGGNVRKIDAAKRSLKDVIDKLPASTHTGVLLFVARGWSGESQLEWLSPIGPVDKDALKAAVDAIAPNGGTPLGSAIKTAADALLEARKHQHNYGNYQLLVVTDGEATPENEREMMHTYAQEVVRTQRRIELDVIGIGMPGKHMLASTAHKYWGANDAVALSKALQTAVQVETTNAAAAQADYDLLNGVPDNVAKAWLADVTNMDLENQPLGEPKEVPAPPASAQNTVPANAQTDPAQPVQADQNQGKEKGCSASTTGINPVPTGLIALCLVSLLAVRRRQMVRVRSDK